MKILYSKTHSLQVCTKILAFVFIIERKILASKQCVHKRIIKLFMWLYYVKLGGQPRNMHFFSDFLRQRPWRLNRAVGKEHYGEKIRHFQD